MAISTLSLLTIPPAGESDIGAGRERARPRSPPPIRALEVSIRRRVKGEGGRAYPLGDVMCLLSCGDTPARAKVGGMRELLSVFQDSVEGLRSAVVDALEVRSMRKRG